MSAALALRVVAALGSLTAVAAGTIYLHRHFPQMYPRERTRLDPRSYGVIRMALALGAVVGGLGAVFSLVDTLGTVQALGAGATGLLAGLAILLPDWLGPAMVRFGVGLLVGGGLFAAIVEVRNARR